MKPRPIPYAAMIPATYRNGWPACKGDRVIDENDRRGTVLKTLEDNEVKVLWDMGAVESVIPVEHLDKAAE